MKRLIFLLLTIYHTSFSQNDIYKGSLYGEPRKTSPSSFYPPKKQIIDEIGIETKTTTKEIEKNVVPQTGKTIIHDSSIIPSEAIGEEITSNLKYFDNFLIYENNNIKYQIKIEYTGENKNLLDFLRKEKTKIYDSIEKSIEETGFSPAKIVIEQQGTDYDFFVFNSSETTKENLQEHYVKTNLTKSDFRGTIQDFQKLNDIPVTGKTDAATLIKVKEYVEFYENTILPNLKVQAHGEQNRYLITDYSEGKTKVVDYTDVDKYRIYKERLLNEEDVLKIEEVQKNQIKTAKIYGENVWASLGSRNDITEQTSFSIGGETIEADWKNLQSYDELNAHWDKYFETNPDINSITILRDNFQTNLSAVDKIDDLSDVGSKILNNKYLIDRTWINITEFARNLKERYPKKKIILSNRMDYLTNRKILRPSIVKNNEDIGAYMASKSFGVKSDQVSEMKNTLLKSKIGVFEIDESMKELPQEAQKANILLISGHKGAALESFMKALADNGFLKGKTIGLLSCYEKGSANLNSYLISGGAKEVHFLPSRISIPATKAVLKEVSKIIGSIRDLNKDGLIFEELLDSGIENAIKNPDNYELLSELKPLKLQIKQISKTKSNFSKYDRG